ncbi:unnamed protein product [Arabidopsis lyrata]|uniref:Proton-dependent oligopeptide transport family protein n=1 Tax=Arabidopsis lyrata subsp. lyrata TaxID=81972 RepID=D7KWU4_ARALL|nr:protein NRT1/ PTR FAMILY 4.2 [Arabidopsis lyrata subsp. lyrata]EFH62876.1 hypothetical protein ARALYDRAFT_893503 [Arabidopsis lyrata subsp. lyrata]CAH8256372.1 unnamed protein product [Arabidopsis lyrata]|eukprot:XP_002886617.1 protein NRT1/ PTR FAMILY 4.2 [Arabidopsis lyrata subsp. lyrata]
MENEILEEKFIDWRGRDTIPGKHGGIRAASIAYVVELLEIMVSIAIGNNMVLYFMKSMHYSPAKAANMVTNFIGTSYLLTLFGGFVTDSFVTRSTTFIIFCSIEILGLLVLTFQAHYPNLQPEGNNTPSTLQSTVLFTGLYLFAFGTGGTRPSLLAHGGDQFDSRHQREISKFFNWYYFFVCFGWLMAITVMAWIKELFNISIVLLAIALCIFALGLPLYRLKRPSGSPLTRIANVFISAARYRNGSVLDVEMMQSLTFTDNNIHHHNKLKCLDKALLNKNISATQVEETRTFIGLLPIFFSTIVMNTCVAQLLTFTVQQGMTMSRKISSSMEIPVPSLNVISIIFILAFISLYELFGKSINRTSSFSLKRIGLGLTLSSISMAVAAIVEAKRKHEAVQNDVRISVFWLMFQYLMLSFSDILTLGGMQEFFYREAPASMKSMSIALGWCSIAMGFFLSSLLVAITNAVSGWLGHQWLGGEDLNKSRLDLFYVLVCVLNTLNLLNYIFSAKRY